MALVRRSAWEQVGGYSHIPGGWEDYDFWCKLIETDFSGILCPQRLARYHCHTGSMLATETHKRLRAISRVLQHRHPWLQLYLATPCVCAMALSCLVISRTPSLNRMLASLARAGCGRPATKCSAPGMAAPAMNSSSVPPTDPLGWRIKLPNRPTTALPLRQQRECADTPGPQPAGALDQR